MSANDTVELALIATLSGQACLNTLHFRQKPTSALGIENEQQLIDAWQAAGQTQWLAIFPNTYRLDLIRARQVCGTLPLRQGREEAVDLTGTRTGAGEVLAPWLAFVITEYTDLIGRSRRGRTYLWAGLESDVSGDTVGTSVTTPASTYATAMINTFGPNGTSNDFQLVVHSRKLAQPGVQCQDSSRPVQRLVVRNRLATQRSRRARAAL